MTEKKIPAVRESKISFELAEHEFEKFAEAMDLDVDPVGMSDEDKVGLLEAKRVFVKAVQSGALIVDDEGQPVFTPQRPGSKVKDPITFYEPTGATLMEIDKAKSGADVSKTFKVLGNLTKTSTARFSGLMYSDLKVCTALMGLFMG